MDVEEDGAVDAADVNNDALFNMPCSCAVSIAGGWIVFCDLALVVVAMAGTGAVAAAADAVALAAAMADADVF